MALNIAFVDPPAPAEGTMFIFNTDSLNAAALYAPGSDARSPLFTFTSADDGKRVVLHYGGADAIAAGALIYHGLFKKGLGVVKIDGRGETQLEDWGRMVDTAMTVAIHGEEYVWRRATQPPANANSPTTLVYQVCAHRDSQRPTSHPP
jgi:hypothetical protein